LGNHAGIAVDFEPLRFNCQIQYVTENTEFRMHTLRYSQQKLPVDSRGASISKVTSMNFHDFLIVAGNLADELQGASM